MTRRTFLGGVSVAGVAVFTGEVAAEATGKPPLPPHIVGVTTSSFAPQSRSTDAKEHIGLDDIPGIMRDELGLGLIDINTTTMGSHDPRHVARFRARAERAGCFITNLKVNANLPIEDEDRTVRDRALAEYRNWIRAAADLGARWLRPIPAVRRPRIETWADSYRRLCDFAEAAGLRILLENYRWIESEPQIIPELIRKLDGRAAAQPDTANWSNQTNRESGLAAAFPLAVSCDFKVRVLAGEGEHPEFDLKQCFDLGVAAGFRGPWAIEHINDNRSNLIRELLLLKTKLKAWSNARA